MAEPGVQTQRTRIKRPKELAKGLASFGCPDETAITSPSAEIVMDILWNIACFIRGEDVMIYESQTFLNKRYHLSIVLNQLLSDMNMPDPAFSLMDMVQPTKERVSIIFTFLLDFVARFDRLTHVRNKLEAERRDEEAKNENLRVDISDCLSQLAEAKKKLAYQDKIRDQLIQLESTHLNFQSQVQEASAAMADNKRQLMEAQMQVSETQEDLRSLELTITRLQENIFPPKATFEEKVAETRQQIRLNEAHLTQLANRQKQLKTKATQTKGDIQSLRFCKEFIGQLNSLQALHRLEIPDDRAKLEKMLVKEQSKLNDALQLLNSESPSSVDTIQAMTEDFHKSMNIINNETLCMEKRATELSGVCSRIKQLALECQH